MTVTTACWSAWPEPPRHFLSSRNDKKPLRSRRSIRLSVTTFGATAEGLSATRVFGLPTAGAARVHRRRRDGEHFLMGSAVLGSDLDLLILKKSRSDPEKTEICTRCCVLVVLGGLVVGFPVGFLTIVSWASRMLA
jgi:hypothetical protein